MARRPAYMRNVDPVPATIEHHMLELGFDNSRDYVDWCWRNGFEGTLFKARSEFVEERRAFEAIRARRRAQERLHKNPKAFLAAVCNGELTSEEIDRPNFKRVAAEIQASNTDPQYRASLLEMLIALCKRDDMVFQTVAGEDDLPFVRGLIKLHDRRKLWLRPLDAWRPKRKARERRFGELTHHLFDRYGDVPRFMERVWLGNDRASRRHRDWYVHLGRGYNLRTAKKLPVTLTRKSAHAALRAPDDYTPEQAIRWGQLSALGAREEAIHATVATRLGRWFDHEDFWITVLRFIAANPMLDPRQIGPLVDYLQHQKFEPTQIEVAPGVWRHEPPPQPGLSMARRTVGTLMRQMEAWHASLGKAYGLPSGSYEKAGFGGMLHDRQNAGGEVRWAIRQLRNARDLQIEGDELRHCVASYHWSCARGVCTIWSLSASDDRTTFKRRVTIEVVNQTIVQCRGLANRDPDADEWAVITQWANRQALRLAHRF